jgi:hypothetical protein
MPRRFDEDVRAARATLGAPQLTPLERVEVRRRVDDSLAARLPLRTRRAALAGGVTVTVAAAAAAVVLAWPAAPYRVVEGPACVRDQGGAVEVAAGCARVVLAVGPDRVEVPEPARLVPERHAVRLLSGTVRVEAAVRQPGARPLRLAVSHGMVVVLGTRYEVTQRDGSGELLVTHGRVGFDWSDGSGRTILQAGERLAWPRVIAPPRPASQPSTSVARPPTPRPPRHGPRVAPDAAVQAIVTRFLQLRSQERYREAAAFARRQAQSSKLTALQRERLSFELGWVLENQLRDHAAACAQWRRHLKTFPASPRAADVRARLRGCGK